ncbi:hypothetical protein [Pseudalkalibacillus caeni]|uniref:Uncharacterized protein n=1 Tax=Exobacillus caeni TaxID=2574798 RepID=A0A5R9EZV5_9BACL|nr:hypothetical protein [Pseudalkalibacillus caeni]TLS35989.1 hypothetical protein FCL54_17505 [Pseudalkalibacillus caeni]
MMYLAEARMQDVVKKQLQFKLKAYRGVFTSLIAVQVLAILFSLGGIGMSGGETENFSYEANYYSGNIVIVLTMLWGFITAVLLTTRAYRFDDFSFVTNRVSSNVSNIYFLIVSCILAGITAMLSSFLLKVLVISFVNTDAFVQASVSFPEYSTGMIGTILYIILFSALGYLVGMFTQIHKSLIVLLPVLLLSTLILSTGHPELIQNIIGFFGNENSFLVFALKTIITAVVLFGASLLVSGRMEVKQ